MKQAEWHLTGQRSYEQQSTPSVIHFVSSCMLSLASQNFMKCLSSFHGGRQRKGGKELSCTIIGSNVYTAWTKIVDFGCNCVSAVCNRESELLGLAIFPIFDGRSIRSILILYASESPESTFSCGGNGIRRSSASYSLIISIVLCTKDRIVGRRLEKLNFPFSTCKSENAEMKPYQLHRTNGLTGSVGTYEIHDARVGSAWTFFPDDVRTSPVTPRGKGIYS